MTPAAILERLAKLGVVACPAAGGMISLAPGGRTPADLRQEILAHKAELLGLLERQARTWQDDASDLIWPSVTGEDPRPDLPGTELWAHLLQLAAGDANDPAGTYGRLLGCRSCGGILERRNGGWRLAPFLDPSERLSVWADRSDWDADAGRWLRPKSAEIVALLRRLPPPDGGSPA